MTREIGILGAGGMAREAASYAREPAVFFAVDSRFVVDGDDHLIDIKNPSERQILTPVVAALGAPAVRAAMINVWPGSVYTNVIADSAEVYPELDGSGIIIAPGSLVTVGTEIGDHTIVNCSASIAHDCRLGEFVTISPGAHVGGNVAVGDGAFIGIGATVSNGVTIAKGAVIGAGAVVINDITQENAVVVGVPGRIVKINEGWLHEV